MVLDTDSSSDRWKDDMNSGQSTSPYYFNEYLLISVRECSENEQDAATLGKRKSVFWQYTEQICLLLQFDSIPTALGSHPNTITNAGTGVCRPRR
jgi:hypothetical protein